MKKVARIAVSLILALFILAAWSIVVRAQQVPVQACVLLADMASVARAMAIAEVVREKADKVIFSVYLMHDELGIRAANRVVDAAYASRQPLREFVHGFGHACVRTGGDLDEVLGRGA